ncbi:hypothetical protein D3C72_1631650 [compost metagenome]
MIGGEHQPPLVLDRLIHHPRQRHALAAQHRARRGRAQRHDHLGADLLQLALQPQAAGLDLLLCRRLVQPPLAAQFELEMLDRIGHEELVAVQARLAQCLVQQVARRPDEGRALQVFLRAGLLAHQHDARMRGALAGHALGGIAPQRATPAFVQFGAADGRFLALGHGGDR